MNDQKFNIAVQYFNRGNFTLAEENLKEAINLDPENLKYQNFLSILFVNKKQYNQAINILKKILEVDNNFLDALINLSNIYVDLEFPEKAVKYFEKACKLNPKNIDLLNNFGLNLLKLNKYNKAKSFFLKVLELDSKNTSALMNLGVINIDRNNSINKKLSFDYYKTGLIKKLNDNYIQAINYWKKTIDLDYSNYAAHFNLGSVYDKFGKIDLANESYTKAININPNYKKAIYNQALIYLKKANFSKGWPGYDLRENCLGTLKIYKSINIKKNQIWNGNPFNGTLVVHGEQGIGDEVLFSSILSELKKIMPKLIVTLDDRLIPMMKRSFPSISFFNRYKKIYIDPNDTKHILFISLGKFFRNSIKDFNKNKKPWLFADATKISNYKKKFVNSHKFKIGISWKTIGTNQYYRSIQLANLSNLLPKDLYEIINLQYGDIQKEIKNLEEKNIQKLTCFNNLDYKNDVDNLAALICSCDLIISIDSFIVHLAGALGSDVWVLVPPKSQWWWHENRTESLWYPNVKIFAKKNIYEWENVINDIKSELNKLSVKRSLF